MAEAQQTYDNTVQTLLNQFPSAYPLLADTYHNMAEMFYSMKDYKNALKYYDKTYRIEQESLLPNQPTLASTYYNLATAYEALKDMKKAIKYAEKAVETARSTFGDDHSETKQNIYYLEQLKQDKR